MAYFRRETESHEGYWGPISSNVDWCEPNYVHSFYLCEFWNTLSNIPMITLGFWGMCYAYLIGREAVQNGITRTNQFYSFSIGFFFLFFVGVGSWMFHMTLLYKYQMLDELPMILGSIVFVYIIMDLRPPKECFIGDAQGEKKPSGILGFFNKHMVENKVLRGTLLTLYGAATSFFMAWDTSSPLPMNLSYLFLILFIVWRCWFLYRSCTGDSYAQKIVRKFFISALVYQITAGICWIIEKELCGPLFPLTAYLHSVWHILAGTGVYHFIVWTFFLSAHNFGLSPKISYFISVPYVSVKSKQ